MRPPPRLSEGPRRTRLLYTLADSHDFTNGKLQVPHLVEPLANPTQYLSDLSQRLNGLNQPAEASREEELNQLNRHSSHLDCCRFRVPDELDVYVRRSLSWPSGTWPSIRSTRMRLGWMTLVYRASSTTSDKYTNV